MGRGKVTLNKRIYTPVDIDKPVFAVIALVDILLLAQLLLANFITNPLISTWQVRGGGGYNA